MIHQNFHTRVLVSSHNDRRPFQFEGLRLLASLPDNNKVSRILLTVIIRPGVTMAQDQPDLRTILWIGDERHVMGCDGRS